MICIELQKQLIMYEQPVFDNNIAASGMGREGLIFKMMSWNTNSRILS